MKTRLIISESGERVLNSIASRFDIRPNIVCRYALLLSLRNPEEPITINDNTGREFNRITLTGEDDILFRELIKSHHKNFISDDDYMTKYLKSHIERGLITLSNNISQAKSFDNYLMQLIMNGELA
jgi:DNA sulfur modification protein DndE